MKLNKILPFTAIAGTVAIVAPMITSCSCARSVKTVWEKKELTQQYEGYTQKCVDTYRDGIKVGELAEKYFNFSKNVRQAINDDFIRTGNTSAGGCIGNFTAETSKFDRDTLRLTSKLEISGQTGSEFNFLLSFNNVPMEFTYNSSDSKVLLTPLGMSAKSMAIWELPNWEIKYEVGQDVHATFNPECSAEEIIKFYNDYSAYIVMYISYFDGVMIK